jgi:hypothetical protein
MPGRVPVDAKGDSESQLIGWRLQEGHVKEMINGRDSQAISGTNSTRRHALYNEMDILLTRLPQLAEAFINH